MRKFAILFFLLSTELLRAQIFLDQTQQTNLTYFYDADDSWAAGVSTFDFNEDGFDDITFVSSSGNLTLWQNDQFGQFDNSILISVPEGNMKSITWVDYDNDMDNDLFLTYRDLGIRLFENVGDFVFNDVTSISGLTTQPSMAFGSSWVDINNDGLLDLYVCNYDDQYSYYDYPKTNYLYKNIGNGSFIDISNSSGAANGYQESFQSIWFDLNDDGFLDMSLINDRNQFNDAFYLNNGDETFSDNASSLNLLALDRSPMSNSISDFDNDGDYDIYKTDFGPSYNLNTNDSLQLHSLNTNLNNTFFTNDINLFNPEPYYFSWAAIWSDFNNDMYDDIFLSTGSIDMTDVNPSLFYNNNMGSSFVLEADVPGTFYRTHGASKGDFNSDGLYDLVLLNIQESSKILLNNSQSGNKWIKITPRGVVSNRNAFGTEVILYAGGIAQRKIMNSCENMCSQVSQNLIFGIGNNSIVDSVVVKFLSGITVVKYDLSNNQSYVINEIDPYSVEIFGVDTLQVCDGDFVNLTSSIYSDITWSNGENSDLITVTATDDYFFSGLDSNGVIIYSDTLHVNFNQTTQPLIQINNTDCNYENGVEIMVTNSAAFENVIFTWNNGLNGDEIDSVSSGFYAVSATYQNGCSSTSSLIYVDNNLNLEIDYLLLPSIYPDSLQLCLNSYGGQEPVIIEVNGDTLNNLECVLIYEFGSYTMSATDNLGCIIQETLILEDVSDLEEIHTLKRFIVDGNKLIMNEEFKSTDRLFLFNSIGQNLQFSFVSSDPLILNVHQNATAFVFIKYEQNGVLYNQKVLLNPNFKQ